MFRKTKFYVALALIAQSVASFVAFIVLLAKKKGGAAAFLAVSGVSGAAGAYLMCECYDEEKALEEYCDGDCDNCDEKDECDAVEDEAEDFTLEGEPFSRDAEAKEDE
ncbi:MAG: hypothetical protein ACI4QR_01790 [Eubacteriales bacterium]